MSEYAIKRLITGPVSVNTYLLFYKNSVAAIDPGGDNNRLVDRIEKSGCTLTHILLTHGHFDHIGAVSALKEATRALCCIHFADEEMLTDPAKNLSAAFGLAISARADILLTGGDVIDFGLGIKVIHTPGHTPGGCCYDTGEHLFTGDTILEYDIGRTDFPGGSYTTLINSIKKKIYTIPGNRDVYPGHGERTTLDDERKYNNFVKN
jgi:hydroxyacylglutathione hydrolase